MSEMTAPPATAAAPAAHSVAPAPSGRQAATGSGSTAPAGHAGAPGATAHPTAAAVAAAPSPTAAPGPQILSASVTPEVVHAGDSVTFAVTTSPDVSAVSARVTGYGLPLGRQGAGRFGLTFTIPSQAPFFMHGDYAVDMQASTTDGRTADRTVSVSFR